VEERTRERVYTFDKYYFVAGSFKKTIVRKIRKREVYLKTLYLEIDKEAGCKDVT
jgi:hypothetical protein